MPEELKLRIPYPAAEEDLVQRGATFLKETHVTDTYFHQPPGHVFKIAEDEDGVFLVRLRAVDGKFTIVQYAPLTEPGLVRRDLTKQFGVKCVLRKRRRFFDFKGLAVNFNLIEGLGEFLVVEGERLDKEAVLSALGLTNPEIITASFDELKPSAS